MTRPVVIGTVMVLLLSPLALGATGVRVEGAFVRTGTFIEVDQVVVGQPVQLLVSVRDISDDPLGVAGGLVDVTWNTNVLELQDAIDDTNATTADVKALFSQAVWARFYTGILVSPGTLEGMGAGQTLPPKLSEDQAELFFRLNFMPRNPGTANVTLTGREFGLIVSGGGDAAAETYESLNPPLTVTAVVDPNDTTNGNGGLPCCGSVSPLMGLAMTLGLSCWLLGRRVARG